MLGTYKYGCDRQFSKTVEDMDPDLAQEKLDPDGNMKPLSDFIYKGFHNSLSHGFYGKWVFITHDLNETDRWIYDNNDRIIAIYIYWFHDRLREIYDDYCKSLIASTDEHVDPLITFLRTLRRNFSMWFV